MKIEVLGTGCADCITLYENTKKAVEEISANAEVIRCDGLSPMLKYGIISPPALVIDGQVRLSGELASVSEIKLMLQSIGD